MASFPRIIRRIAMSDTQLRRESPISRFIVAPRAQASRRCETQATLGGQAAKLCYRFGPLTPSARSANLIVGDGTKNGRWKPRRRHSAIREASRLQDLGRREAASGDALQLSAAPGCDRPVGWLSGATEPRHADVRARHHLQNGGPVYATGQIDRPSNRLGAN